MPITDLVHGWCEMDYALPAYIAAEDAAAGRVEEMFPDPILQERLAPLADRYRFPIAGIPIDVLADRMELRDVIGENEAVNDAIARISEANILEARMPVVIRTALTYGDAYLMVWPAPEAGEDAGTSTRMLADARVTIDVQNPKHCRMFYDDESDRIPKFLIKRWEVRTPIGRAWRADVYYPGTVERWRSKVGEDPKEEGSWDAYSDPAAEGDDDGSTILTPTGDQIPFIHFRTGLPYGTPVHIAAYGCQDAATKLLVTQLDATDSHGWPQRWRLLTLGAELDQATDNAPWSSDDDSDDTRNRDGSVPSATPSGPGTLQTFTGTESVGQFDAADPKVFTDPAQIYIRLMGLLTHTPLYHFDTSGGTPPSGESLKVANMPLIKRAARFSTLMTASIHELWDYALRVYGLRPTRFVDVQWAPANAAVGTSDWEEVTAKQLAGVPITDTLVEAGYPRERVEEWELPDHPADFDPAPPVVTVPVPAPGMLPADDPGVSGA